MGLLAALGLRAPKKLAPAAAAALPPAAGLAAGSASSDAGDAAEPVGDSAAPAPADAASPAYDTALAALQAAVKALRAHPSVKRIQARIDAIEAEIKKAQTLAGAKKHDAAVKVLDAAAKLADAAKARADDHARYAKQRADVKTLIRSVAGLLKTGDDNAEVAKADALVYTASPDFPAAFALLTGVATTLSIEIEDKWITPQRKQIDDLKALPAAAWAAPEIAQIEAMQAQLVADVKSGAWSGAVMATRRLPWLIHPVQKMVERRGVYEAQRRITVPALDALRGNPELKDWLADLDASFKEAEALAERGAMRFEDGRDKLVQVAERCRQFALAADAAARYRGEAAAVGRRRDELAKHPAASKIAGPLSAVRKQLADAAGAAQHAMGGGVPAQGFESALATVERAASDLEVAAKLADSFGPAMQVRAEAAKVNRPEEARKALEDLRRQADAAKAAPYAKQAAEEFRKFDQAWASADAAVGERGEKKTIPPLLVAAADALVAAQTVQSDHNRFVTMRLPVAARLDALRAHAAAPKLGTLIDPLAKAIADADTADARKDGEAAVAALRAADAAANKADEAAAARAAFDARDAGFAKRIAKLSDKAARAERDKMLADARAKADAMDFTGAGRALDAIEVKFSADEARRLAASKPNGQELQDCADKMMALGGGKEVDALIQSLPNTVDRRAVLALAKKRFGIEITAGPDTSSRTVKGICAVFAKVPEDVRGNLSLKKVKHTDSNSNGGAYGTEDSDIELNGRPGQSKELFTDKARAGGLPVAEIEDDCKPANDKPEDYLSFAALHEVGHAVDDANNFMETRQNDATYGGWMSHGSDVGPIADAVAAEMATRAKIIERPELRDYAFQSLMRAKPERPKAPDDVDAAAWKTAFDEIDKWYKLAVSQKAWEQDAVARALKVGERVYQMAYEQDWVSYLYSARTRGLTAYQFRAGGEWFAELYAGFHSGKLKPSHPAAAWLSTLKS